MLRLSSFIRYFSLYRLSQRSITAFFENYRSGLKQIGPNFIALENYKALLANADIWKYTENTFVMWIIGFVPQIVVSLLLASWFSDPSLRIKGQRFFKTVIYLPNLIMAAAFAMLFFTLFADSGPINSMLVQAGILAEPYKFMSNTGSARILVGFMNFLMWFGNTTILLLAGMMGIDTSLYEAAEVDGAPSPFVRICGTSNIWRPPIRDVISTKTKIGLSIGIVILQKI